MLNPNSRRKAIVLIFVLWTGLGLAGPAGAQSPQAQGTFTILLSNDDGYGAPGLNALIEALRPIADVYVAAPAVEQSGKGHSIITTRDPIFLQERKQPSGVTWYAIEAPPATCVRLAIESLLPRRPDLVISGINRGENLGINVYLSGTLGAAREAAIARIPAIAVSMGGSRESDFAATATFIRDLVQQLREKQMLKPGFFLNVNHPAGEVKGVMVTQLSTKANLEKYQRRASPRGRIYYWSEWEPLKDDAEGTDVWAFVRGYIALTPMALDVTAAQATDALRIFESRTAVAK